jgi:lipooligosaccharide transport system permease protein
MAPFGVYSTVWGAVLAFLVQFLVALAFATPIYGFSAGLKDESPFSLVFRLGMIPLFLFSGAFFPVANLGEFGAWIARLTPLWQGVNLSRMFCLDTVDWPLALLNLAVLVGLSVLGWVWAVRGLDTRLEV